MKKFTSEELISILISDTTVTEQTIDEVTVAALSCSPDDLIRKNNISSISYKLIPVEDCFYSFKINYTDNNVKNVLVLTNDFGVSLAIDGDSEVDNHLRDIIIAILRHEGVIKNRI